MTRNYISVIYFYRRYGRQEYDFNNNHSCFWIRTPVPGAYKLLIYAKLINAEPNVPESDSQKMFGAICEYKIDSNFPVKQALQQFPPCQSSTYGPNEVNNFGFIHISRDIFYRIWLGHFTLIYFPTGDWSVNFRCAGSTFRWLSFLDKWGQIHCQYHHFTQTMNFWNKIFAKNKWF